MSQYIINAPLNITLRYRGWNNNADIRLHFYRKVQHPCDNCIQDQTDFNLYIPTDI
jgi:hypothetical protein